jgi:hypothetical protein
LKMLFEKKAIVAVAPRTMMLFAVLMATVHTAICAKNSLIAMFESYHFIAYTRKRRVLSGTSVCPVRWVSWTLGVYRCQEVIIFNISVVKGR